ncbi:MAG TPA: arginine decarboxylase, partial [Symbiobacteriaceae bacterium]|nr:arginine decarboxylase [Symbiobacteriaceae bacterium]
LPPSAMAAGADMAATSMHKLGGSLVQTSLLHVKGGRVDPSRVQAAISMLTSTSTSYILLASLDMARMQLATRGTELLDETLKLAVAARRELCRIPGLGLLGGERPSRLLDPTKLCMSTRGLGLSGVTAERRLRAEHRVEVEMSDLCNILCLLSLGHRRADVDALLEALWALAGEGARAPEPGPVPPCALPPLGVLDMSPREAYFSPAELVPLQEAAGRVIAESVLAYPPGIPALVPGERISGEHIDYIRQCLLGGLPMQGAEDPTFSHLKVVRKR